MGFAFLPKLITIFSFPYSQFPLNVNNADGSVLKLTVVLDESLEGTVPVNEKLLTGMITVNIIFQTFLVKQE